jgi:hypothetical protein
MTQPDDDQLPDATQMTGRQLRLLRDFFHDLAQKALWENNRPIMNWARAVVDRYAFELNLHTRNRRDLQAYIDAKRAIRPHGSVPGDTTGIPPWGEATTFGDPPETNPWA